MYVFLRQNRLPRLESARLSLREIGLDDISDEYLRWLNDPEVTKFLEIRFVPQTEERVRNYVESHLQDIHSSMHFGVYMTLNEDTLMRQLVGTTTVNSINRHHMTADISFVVGHQQAKNRGVATESVHAVCAYLFTIEHFFKITGGHYANNAGSAAVFKKNAFMREGVRRQQCLGDDGVRTDGIIYGLLKSEFMPQADLLGHDGHIHVLHEAG